MKISSKYSIVSSLVLLAALFSAHFSYARELARTPDQKSYIIACKEDLLEVMGNSSWWTQSFVQTNDIDLSGVDWTPIGNGATPFRGSYDGLGHTISNLTVRWDEDLDSDHTCFGFFGYLGGPKSGTLLPKNSVIIKNIHFDNIHITRTAAGKTLINDIKLGVFAGMVSQRVTINNIAITNSRIDDGGSLQDGFKDHCAITLMVGGMIGDMASHFDGTSTVSSDNATQITNISVDVDVNLSHFERAPVSNANKRYQFHFGGIVGRMRYIPKQGIPKNTFFTGTVNAPYSTIGPVYSAIRSSTTQNQAMYLLSQYAGDMNNTPDIIDRSDLLTQYFSDFTIVNRALATATNVITDTYPSADGCAYDTRTLTPNADLINSTAALSYTSPTWMSKFQGVNFGNYRPSPTTDAEARAEILSTLTSTIPSTNDRMRWRFDGTNFIIEDLPVQASQCQMNIVVENGRYKAVVTDLLTGYDRGHEGTWKWYSRPDMLSGDWEEIPGATSDMITPNGYLNYMAEWTAPGDGNTLAKVRGPMTMVYVYDRERTIDFNSGLYSTLYPELTVFDTDTYNVDGDDANDGFSPFTPVRSMEAAYERLHADGDMHSNVVVIMGFYYDPDFLIKPDTYTKPATISGSDHTIIYGGILNLDIDDADSETILSLQSQTRLEELSLFDDEPTRVPSGKISIDKRNHIFIICNFYDFMVDRGVKMYHIANSAANLGLPGNFTAVPNISVVAANFNNNNNNAIIIPEGNRVPGRTSIDIYSGGFARIISCSRNTSSNLKWRVSGAPEGPIRTTVTINIDSQVDNPDDPCDYGYSYSETADGDYDKREYSHNVGLLTGGQTDGSCWADNEVNLINGRVGRIISGNITYGRLAWTNGDPTYRQPDDTFFGRSIVNMSGGFVNEIYGGSLGRDEGIDDDDTRTVNAYFYGESQINISGGEVRRYKGNIPLAQSLKNISATIYGAGAGGIVGLGHLEPGHDVFIEGTEIRTYTDDQFIPYYDNGGILCYGDYAEATAPGSTIPVIQLLNSDGTTELLDLAKSHISLNLCGGTIEDDLYGGGHGYSNNIKQAIHLNPMGGAVYGNTSLKMWQAGNGASPTILGNVYGGGCGSDKVAQHVNLGITFGDTDLDITGGYIRGDLFAGSRGVEGVKEMAAIYGNTRLHLGGNATINGDIYGGCAYGSIHVFDCSLHQSDSTGNVEITVDGNPTIGNRIFGGSMGALDDNMTPVIEGNVTVNIDGGSFIATPWFETTPKENRRFNIYAGGYLSCNVKGNTTLNISRSPLTDIASICDDPNDFQLQWDDLRTRRFCVYGGGYGLDTFVEGTATVNIDLQDRNVLIDPEDGIQFYSGKQFFDITGGGFNGDVNKAVVNSGGNLMARKVIGGGLYGSVRTSTNTTLRSGMYSTVVGGCLMGYVWKRANLTVGTHTSDGSDCPDNAELWIMDNIYGGNDVQGIVGIVPMTGFEYVDEDPYNTNILYAADVDDPEKGAFINIYGGKIYGSVYGAGNGHYRGYYVPGWAAYNNGPDRFYREVPARIPEDPENPFGPDYHRVYKTRPTIGQVNLNIQGNSETDRVFIHESVFGGGRDCTIGQWNSALQVEDPRRLTLDKGGSLNMNFGSHVTVNHHVHMGARGHYMGDQPVFEDYSKVREALNYPEALVPSNFLTEKVGNGAYYHWYWDGDAGEYRPGYPAPGKMFENPYGTWYGQNPDDPDKSFFLLGEYQFYGFLKFIEMASKVSLTFYDDPWDPTTGQLKPQNPDPENIIATNTVHDVKFDSFFLGGERGFMTYHSNDPSTPYSYDLTLPYGITIEDKVVAGGEDTWISYYKYSDDYSSFDKEQTIYELRGGLTVPHIFHESDSDPANLKVVASAEGWAPVITEGTRSDDYAICLNVSSKFEPRLDTDAFEGGNLTQPLKRHGGLVFGGCFDSGYIDGDLVLNVASNLLGDDPIFDMANADAATYKDLCSMKYNIGRVFGGGFGQRTCVRGNTYVHLLRNFRGMNVFGGSMMGDVKGSTEVVYFGTEQSYVYGNIYGGGMVGDVGRYDADGTPLDKFATSLRLYSGNVGKVYGGGCLGDVYGATRIYACDDLEPDIPYFDWQSLHREGWGESRLIAGAIFGGNDIAGKVIIPEDADYAATNIHIDEKPMTTPPTPAPHRQGEGPQEVERAAGKDSPGSHGGYNGFPLVGAVYGGSNGDYGIHDVNGYYAEGSLITMATGDSTYYYTSDLALLRYKDRQFRVPHIVRSDINVTGGTIVSAYGGGARSNVTESVNITVNYGDTIARAGFTSEAEAQRIWRLLDLHSDEQFNEVLRPTPNDEIIYDAQIFRVFGGNDNFDMDIQPRWNLRKGHIESVYSGGNMGRMTYYNPSYSPTAADRWLRSAGLSIWIDSPDIRIDNIYGGSRVGDVCATDESDAPVTFADESQYGSTVNVLGGIIEHVYGGNDVSGTVYNGSRVNLMGAISGDVYGAGNGNYLYKYDTTGNYTARKVTETYDPTWGRVFVIRADEDFGGIGASQEQRILAINHYRPNATRARLDIRGVAPTVDAGGTVTDPGSTVYVKGNVFCGGNSSTVSATGDNEDIVFHIGSNVMLNSVYLGSNGRSLSDGNMIYATEELNNLDMTADNEFDTALIPASVSPGVSNYLTEAAERTLYPSRLSLYMRAVEVTAQPKQFSYDDDLSEAYIGEFCVGGNKGSMLTDRTIKLSFPEQLVIYNRIVAGCNDANVRYKTATHIGGLTKPLASGSDKVVLDVAAKFMPMVLQYPVRYTEGAMPIALHGYMLDENKQPLYEQQDDNSFVLRPGYTGKKYYPNGMCNIYGGCFTSGRTVGDITINLYSDMLDYSSTVFNPVTGIVTDGRIDKQAVVDGVDDFSWRAFDVIGGGYGRDTEVYGNIHVRMLPTKASPYYDADSSPLHPSAGSIFGGSQNGLVVGNTTIEVRDGNILTNIYGASESAVLYGSTQTIVGYPEYRYATVNGNYTLKRADDLPALHPEYNHDGTEVVRSKVAYRIGDIVPTNIYELIEGDKEGKFSDPVVFTPSDVTRTVATETPLGTSYTTSHPVSWNDIDISVGDRFSLRHIRAPYYGHGNIYGGGFVPSQTDDASIIGSLTVKPFEADIYNLGAETVGYGGNSCVLVWDNPRNADLSISEDDYQYTETGLDGDERTILLRDHVAIGTGHYTLANLHEGDDAMGCYLFDPTLRKFIHQPSGTAESDHIGSYFRLSADGGIYGGGRKVYVQGFRAVDVKCYGYADYTPQSPKLLNTFQRADLVSVTDCTIMLHGASDFTTIRVDATLYAINRVGALRMNSTIPATTPLDPGQRMSDKFLYNIDHNKRRSRNYLAFFNKVNFLASYVSNVDYTDTFHDANGNVDSEGKSYLERKHEVVQLYDSDKSAYTAEFNRRNVATAANMIGICNGYSLQIQGYYTEQIPGQTNAYSESSYYGPIFGVTEIKLLTLAVGEGGGYVFARNHHFEPSYDPDHLQGFSESDHQDFLHTTGNFVFPGAAFLVGSTDYNYVIDDCMPMLHGYYEYLKEYEEAHPGTQAPRRGAAPAGFNVNEAQDVHYWYVNGQRFFYNLTLTAYTGDTADDPMNFWLNNSDGMVLLAGTQPGSNITVKEVTWLDPDPDYDLGRLDLDYNLRITVDSNTRLGANYSDVTSDAYIADIPRANYLASDTEAPAHFDPNAGNTTSFRNHADGMNTPSVGIRLTDAVNNGKDNPEGLSSAQYFNKHLKDPHMVKIVLTSTDENDVEFEYTFNLNIVYLLGPDFDGNIVIENCALPGEYIYANANDVVMVSDPTASDLMTITDRTWMIYPLDSHGHLSENGFPINDFKVPGTDTEIRLPAYFYQNGWQLRYRITVNGTDFFAHTDADAEHPALTVHNYHRMRPFDGTTLHDLRFAPGARIYIEDYADIYRFFTYMSERQVHTVHPDETRFNLEAYGIDIDPDFGEGLDFFLMDNMELPPDSEDIDPIVMKARFHGNGHILHIGSNTHIPFINKGTIINLGFVGEYDQDHTVIDANSDGILRNCYYYNTQEAGALAADGELTNCYQNVPLAPGSSFAYNQLLPISSAAFHYGQVAYNLNGYYLEKRDKLLQAGADNTHDSLNLRDMELRDNADAQVFYIEEMFNNGDYQYALANPLHQFREALRTSPIPNYLDMMDQHARGLSPTFHDTSHPHDPDRWCETHQMCHPIFAKDDYVFFGQEISAAVADTSLPSTFSPATRVYRAGGFYGSMADKGTFFNKDVYISSTKLTAIDVTGIRDHQLVDEYAKLHDPAITPNWDGWIIHPMQEIYYPPTLDMPYMGHRTFDINSVTIENTTRNLLIYDYADDHLIDQYHYQDAFAPTSEHDLAAHDDSEETIRAHHIVVDPNSDFSAWTAEAYAPAGASESYFHLVDNENFNVPIEFTASYAFYNRHPGGFANATFDKSAWEGIYLPFTVDKVFSISMGRNAFRDHGELTHFFDDDLILHEYWLRRFTGVSGSDLAFSRPTASNQGDASDFVGSKSFFNPYFKRAFEDAEYNLDHDRYSENHTFSSYRYLTAAVPYIITYPGRRYLEFDMSGQYYAERHGEGLPYDQTLSYISAKDIVIPVSDLQNHVAYSHGGYTMRGTFSQIEVDGSTPIAVIPAYDPDTEGHDGSQFELLSQGESVMPFRTYIVKPTFSPAPHHISSGDRQQEIDLPVEPEEAPEDGDDSWLDVYVVDNVLCIDSSYPTELTIFDTLGRAVRLIRVEVGTNRYDDIPTGFYLVGSAKVRIN